MSSRVKEESAMFTKEGLKARGWTDSLVAKFFPVPTKRQKNSIYRKGPDILLYAEEQVFEIEKTKEFQSQLAKAAIRSERGKVAAEKRRLKTLEWVASLPQPDLPKLSKEKLRKLACRNYNELWSSRGPKYAHKYARIDDVDIFLDRISVNFLRHELTDYEERLYCAAGRIGASDARVAIKDHILDAIAEAYPWLANECCTQKINNNNNVPQL